ncbi:hypothetical protein PR048_003093 [Dryococelus australis]|uniref:D domain-containing protein n=1 Tax=Dryococelus australis TaxID=614101 RepID=A0ABQ9IPB4_9NEOP|nr:hypothetical protein PR048_003093 [Dryococelus australis]
MLKMETDKIIEDTNTNSQFLSKTPTGNVCHHTRKTAEEETKKSKELVYYMEAKTTEENYAVVRNNGALKRKLADQVVLKLLLDIADDPQEAVHPVRQEMKGRSSHLRGSNKIKEAAQGVQISSKIELKLTQGILNSQDASCINDFPSLPTKTHFGSRKAKVWVVDMIQTCDHKQLVRGVAWHCYLSPPGSSLSVSFFACASFIFPLLPPCLLPVAVVVPQHQLQGGHRSGKQAKVREKRFLLSGNRGIFQYEKGATLAGLWLRFILAAGRVEGGALLIVKLGGLADNDRGAAEVWWVGVKVPNGRPPAVSEPVAIIYGRVHEKITTSAYEKEMQVTVQPCGLFVHPEVSYLGASPDGILEKNALFYIECLLPELEDSRISRGMRVREPPYILEAREGAKEKKQYPMTILYDPARKKEPSSQYSSERETCIKFFEKWSEQDQVEFVEHLLSRMCHYQHGHINSYLKPMLQRDFITLLPSALKVKFWVRYQGVVRMKQKSSGAAGGFSLPEAESLRLLQKRLLFVVVFTGRVAGPREQWNLRIYQQGQTDGFLWPCTRVVEEQRLPSAGRARGVGSDSLCRWVPVEWALSFLNALWSDYALVRVCDGSFRQYNQLFCRVRIKVARAPNKGEEAQWLENPIKGRRDSEAGALNSGAASSIAETRPFNCWLGGPTCFLYLLALTWKVHRTPSLAETHEVSNPEHSPDVSKTPDTQGQEQYVP